MAERVIVIRECDSQGCRRRKGVEKYTFTAANEAGENVFEKTGELCPYHFDLNVKRIEKSMSNTKGQ